MEKTINESVLQIKSKKITCESVVKECHQTYNMHKNVNAFLSSNFEAALLKAKEIDKKINEGKPAGRLAGIPLIIADNIATTAFPTSCNNKYLKNNHPFFNATVVDKLSAENALILGKGNISEFGMAAATNALENSAAAVNLSMCAALICADTNGAMRMAAIKNNAVALKPTQGTVSRFGLVAYAGSMEQIGPIAKTVNSCAAIYNVIAGYDEKEATSINRTYPNFNNSFKNSVQGLKIGIIKELDSLMNNNEKTLFQQALSFYKQNGAVVSEVSIPSLPAAPVTFQILSSAEAMSNMHKYDGVKYGEKGRTYPDVNALYTLSRTEGLGSEVKTNIATGAFVLGSGNYENYYVKALKVREVLKNEIFAALKKCDCILSQILVDNINNSFLVLQNLTGCPALAFPPHTNNEKFGLQLTGAPFSEQTLFNAADFYQNNK